MKGLVFGALLLAFLVVLVSPGELGAQGKDPAAVVGAFDAALNAGDVDATLALFAADAVVTTQTATFTGQAQIRRLLTQWVAEHSHFTSSQRQVSGDTETHRAKVARDPWRKLGISSLDALATVVVRNGQITSCTVTYPPESLAKLPAATPARCLTAAESRPWHALGWSPAGSPRSAWAWSRGAEETNGRQIVELWLRLGTMYLTHPGSSID